MQKKITKKITKFFKKNWQYILIAFVVVLAYGRTINMYWWVDDWGLLFKMIHPESSPGNLGPGVVGYGPYRYLSTPFILLFPIIRYSTKTYFTIGLILYYLCAVLVYQFVKEISKSKKAPIISACIFASGYIGSYAIYRLSNSYQLTGSVIFILITALNFVKYYKSKKSKYYLYTLLFFILTLEFFFLRSNGILVVTLGIALYYWFDEKKKIKKYIFDHIPLFLVYYLYYFKGFAITPHAGGANSSSFLDSTIDLVFVKKQYEVVVNFLLTFIRMIFPANAMQDRFRVLTNWMGRYGISQAENQLLFVTFLFSAFSILVYFLTIKKIKIKSGLFKLSILWCILSLVVTYIFVLMLIPRLGLTINQYEKYSVVLGLNFLGYVSWFSYIKYKTSKTKDSLLVYLGILIIVSSFFSYFVYNPTTNLDSTSRYVLLSLVGTSILIASLVDLIKIKSISYLLGILVSVTYIYLTNQDIDYILKYVSIPDKQGYELIKNDVLYIDSETVFYIETSDDSVYKNNVLGGMPQLGISIVKNYGDNVKIADSYKDLYKRLANKEVKPDNIYTYYYDENGYISTTQEIREILSKGISKNISVDNLTIATSSRSTLIEEKQTGTLGVNPVFEINADIPSLSPTILEFDMKVSPVSLQSLKYPYFDLTNAYINNPTTTTLKDFVVPDKSDLSKDTIESVLKQQSDDTYLYRYGKAWASSSGKSEDAQYSIDSRKDTYWSSRNVEWNDGQRPQSLTIELPSVNKISYIGWVNHHFLATPINYSFEVSLDGLKWRKVVEVKNGVPKSAGETTEEKFTLSDVKLVRFNIYETYKDSPPAVDEIFFRSDVLQVDEKIQEKVKSCPFCFVESINAAEVIYENLLHFPQAKVAWITNKDVAYSPLNIQSFDIFVDGNYHRYQIYIPARGTSLRKVRLYGFTFPVKTDIKNISIKTANFDEIKRSDVLD